MDISDKIEVYHIGFNNFVLRKRFSDKFTDDAR